MGPLVLSRSPLKTARLPTILEVRWRLPLDSEIRSCSDVRIGSVAVVGQCPCPPEVVWPHKACGGVPVNAEGAPGRSGIPSILPDTWT